MSVYIDKKYISLLATKLTLFKQRGEFLWNFRCPVCGDSQKNKIRTRGYIYKRKEHFGFMCHNCGSNMGLSKFIKYVDPSLYNEYQLESFVQSNTLNHIILHESTLKIEKYHLIIYFIHVTLQHSLRMFFLTMISSYIRKNELSFRSTIKRGIY
jgi:transcription elongation factor Elf1